MYSRGVKEVQIVCRAGRENVGADALSRSPHAPAPDRGIGEEEIQVAVVSARGAPPQEPVSQQGSISSLLESAVDPLPRISPRDSYLEEQKRDPQLREGIAFLNTGVLPEDEVRARKVATQAPLFTIVDGTLYYIDSRHGCIKRAVVPRHLGLYSSLAPQWWWEGMYTEALAYCKNYPECATATGTGRIHKPPLCPIPVRSLSRYGAWTSWISQRPSRVIGMYSCVPGPFHQMAHGVPCA